MIRAQELLGSAGSPNRHDASKMTNLTWSFSSSAKGMIYTLVGGVDPGKILPIALDVGTNNQDLLKDNMYLVRAVKQIVRPDIG